MTECKKTKFANELQADLYIKKLQWTSYRKKKPVRAYLCPDCLTWHLTSRTEKDDLLIENLYKSLKEKNALIAEKNERIRELKAKIKHQNGGWRACDQSNIKLPDQK